MSNTAEVIALHQGSEMSEKEFEQEYARIVETWGTGHLKDGNARRAMAVARLAANSGWTQERIGKRLAMSHQQADRTIRFGKFLNWKTLAPMGAKLPPLTERKFRGHWLKTSESAPEFERFAEVVKLIEAEPLATEPKRTKEQRAEDSKRAKHITKQFGDGKWHEAKTIAKALGMPVEEVSDAIKAVPVPPPAVDRRTFKIEQGGGGAVARYRLFRQDKTLSSDELREKLLPLLKAVDDELAQQMKHQAYWSPGNIRTELIKLRRTFDQLTAQ